MDTRIRRPSRAKGYRALLAAFAMTIVVSCGTWPDTRVDERWAQAVLFPIQVVPNILTTTVVCLVRPFVRQAQGKDPGNLCVLSVIGAPFIGLGFGIAFAAHGVPFWTIFDTQILETEPVPPEPSTEAK